MFTSIGPSLLRGRYNLLHGCKRSTGVESGQDQARCDPNEGAQQQKVEQTRPGLLTCEGQRSDAVQERWQIIVQILREAEIAQFEHC